MLFSPHQAPRVNDIKHGALNTQQAQHIKLTFRARKRQSYFSNLDNPTFQVTILLNLLPFIKVPLITLSNSPTFVLIFLLFKITLLYNRSWLSASYLLFSPHLILLLLVTVSWSQLITLKIRDLCSEECTTLSSSLTYCNCSEVLLTQSFSARERKSFGRSRTFLSNIERTSISRCGIVTLK